MILLAAAVVSFVIACIEGNPMEFFEPALILLIVVLNAVMGMLQESKAEKALDALKNMSAPHARVIARRRRKNNRCRRTGARRYNTTGSRGLCPR